MRRLDIAYLAGRVAGWFRTGGAGREPARAIDAEPDPKSTPQAEAQPRGISVVIPSRNGRSLLAAQLTSILRDLPAESSEVIIVDNGSEDDTAGWLAAAWPRIRVAVSTENLSFARAINRGISQGRFSHICLLNNDMLVEPGFFTALMRAFDMVPELFCATAQIRFPAGVRREETGKAVMAQSHPDDFPLRCDEPFAGEDLSYVLYGSGGCSLYDGARLTALGGVDEAYEPAYVEDLDLGYRAWRRGWPTVYVAGAVVEHRHRATTSRYYSAAELDTILETNYLKFLARAVADKRLFGRLWKQALQRLHRRRHEALLSAASIARAGLADRAAPPPGALDEEAILALTSGDVAVFPGRAAAEPLVMFAERLERPSPELLAAHCEVVVVRNGQELGFRAVRRLTGRKWKRAR